SIGESRAVSPNKVSIHSFTANPTSMNVISCKACNKRVFSIIVNGSKVSSGTAGYIGITFAFGVSPGGSECCVDIPAGAILMPITCKWTCCGSSSCHKGKENQTSRNHDLFYLFVRFV